MRYISEETLVFMAKEAVVNKPLLESLISIVKEIDQLTVSKLRPMRDAPNFEQILCFDGEKWETWIMRPETNMYGDYAKLKGWIPMPIYKPEK